MDKYCYHKVCWKSKGFKVCAKECMIFENKKENILLKVIKKIIKLFKGE